MNFVMPLKGATPAQLFSNNLCLDSGQYIFGKNQHWHGGAHYTINKPVQSATKGRLIAYRLDEDYGLHKFKSNNKVYEKPYSPNFALVQHKYVSPKGSELSFYSLYMHLMSANEIKAKKLVIPKYLRSKQEEKVKAIVVVSEDSSRGLNLRDPKTSAKKTTVPVGCKLEIISPPEGWESNPDYVEYKRKTGDSNDFHLVNYTDPSGKEFKNLYGLLDSSRAVIDGNTARVITIEDYVANSKLKGLNIRENGKGGKILYVAPKGAELLVENSDEKNWLKVFEVNGEELEFEGYVYAKNKLDIDKVEIDDSKLGGIRNVDIEVDTEELLGYPGKNLFDSKVIHFEIFGDDNIKDFMKNPKGEGEKSIVQVPANTKLCKPSKNIVHLWNGEIKSGSKLEVEVNEDLPNLAKVNVIGKLVLLDRGEVGWDKHSRTYNIKAEHLEKYKKMFGYEISEKTKLKFLGFATDKGEYSKTEVGTKRYAELEFKSKDKFEVWVKKEKLNTIDIGNHGQYCAETIQEVYPDLPDSYSFTEITTPSTDFAWVNSTDCPILFDCESDKWIEVTLPFDAEGGFSPNTNKYVVPRPDAKKGWVRLKDCKAVSPFDWPGFKVMEEVGKGGEESEVDFKNLNPFFRDLVESMDVIDDDIISHEELNKALANPVILDRLNRTVVKHPSEWEVDDDFSKWEHLKPKMPEDLFLATKTHIQDMAWWNKVDGMPNSEIYHFNPVEFLVYMQNIRGSLGVLLNKKRLKPEEIARARKIIETAAEGDKAEYYLKLQEKVSYRNQRNNNTTKKIADGMCNLTSLAMAFEYLGIECPEPDMQFEDYLESLRVEICPNLERIYVDVWRKISKKMGCTLTHIDLKTNERKPIEEAALRELKAGNGVIVSAFSRKSKKGHIVRLQSVNDNGIVVDDPFGRVNNFAEREAGGFGYSGTSNTRTTEQGKGEDNLWTWENIADTQIKYICSIKKINGD